MSAYWGVLTSIPASPSDMLQPPSPPWIMNKIIIVCSMKFLPRFPPLMIILFKIYQLENILSNLNTNESPKCVWKSHNVNHCFPWTSVPQPVGCDPTWGPPETDLHVEVAGNSLELKKG